MIQNSGIQDVQNILDGITAAQNLVQEACSTDGVVNFSAIFAENYGKTAFNDLMSKVELAKDANALEVIRNLSDALRTAQHGLALYTIKIRDPNVDGVAREAYQADPTFQAMIRTIGAKSSCMPDAWVNWEPTVSGSTVSFAVSVNAPVAMLMDAPISVVPTDAGGLAFFADGSRLENASYWDYETSTEKPCTRGEERILSHVTFDSSATVRTPNTHRRSSLTSSRWPTC